MFLAKGRPPAQVSGVDYKFDGDGTEEQVKEAMEKGAGGRYQF